MQTAAPRRQISRLAHRRAVSWQVVEPALTVQEIMSGNGGFNPTDHDMAVLETLLRHNYMTAWQAAAEVGLYKRHGQIGGDLASQRLSHWFRVGAVTRGWLRLYDEKRNRYVFSLTLFGMELLLFDGNPHAKDVSRSWKPPFEAEGTRNSVFHEIGVSDFCSRLVVEARRTGNDVAWYGSRESGVSLSPHAAGGRSFTISPDSVVVPLHGHPVAIEYERTGRLIDIREKLDKYRRMAALRAWPPMCSTPPDILYVASPRMHSKHTSAGVYDVLLHELESSPVDGMLLTSPEQARTGDWAAYVYRRYQPLQQLALLDALKWHQE